VASKKTKRKNILGGHVYLVEEVAGGNHVHKVPNEGEEGEVFLIDSEDGQCQCRAAEFGNDCKHQSMVSGTLEKEEISRRKAEEILEDYLDKLRASWPRAQVVSLLQYKRTPKVGSAAALACGVLSQHAAEKLTVWSEFGPLLIRVYCFKDRDRYRQALRAVRKRWSNDSYDKPDVDVGPAGKTDGEESEGSDGTS